MEAQRAYLRRGLLAGCTHLMLPTNLERGNEARVGLSRVAGKMLHKLMRAGAAIGCALMLIGAGMAAVDVDRMLQTLVARFGAPAEGLFQAWRDMQREARELPEREQLARVNDFFDRRLQFRDDQLVWNQADYWATPLEFLGKGAGDCEDFALAKYFSLVELGVSPQKLRLIYVRARLPGAAEPVAHMVLGYYERPDAEPLVLDNLQATIRPASQRPDLAPVFSFNAEGVWMGAAARAIALERHNG